MNSIENKTIITNRHKQTNKLRNINKSIKSNKRYEKFVKLLIYSLIGFAFFTGIWTYSESKDIILSLKVSISTIPLFLYLNGFIFFLIIFTFRKILIIFIVIQLIIIPVFELVCLKLFPKHYISLDGKSGYEHSCRVMKNLSIIIIATFTDVLLEMMNNIIPTNSKYVFETTLTTLLFETPYVEILF